MNEKKKPGRLPDDVKNGTMLGLTWKGKMLLAALDSGLLAEQEDGSVETSQAFENFCELAEQAKDEEVMREHRIGLQLCDEAERQIWLCGTAMFAAGLALALIFCRLIGG